MAAPILSSFRHRKVNPIPNPKPENTKINGEHILSDLNVIVFEKFGFGYVLLLLSSLVVSIFSA